MNAYLEAWRTRQHDHEPTTSDAQFEAFLAGVDARAAQLDRAAHATDLELRMISRVRAA